MYRTAILPAMRDNLNSETAIEDTVLSQMLEREMGYGTSSKNRRRGRIDRVANQCAKETLNIHIYLHLLGVTEYL